VDHGGWGIPDRVRPDPAATGVDEPLAPEVPPAPHSASGEQVPLRDLAELAPPPRSARRWTPRRVVVTPAAPTTRTRTGSWPGSRPPASTSSG
jgi:spore photoproduct lyase